jgi:hypothetical protein
MDGKTFWDKATFVDRLALFCPVVHIVRVIEQCFFNSTPDPFNGQTANFILEPPKVIESRTYVEKVNPITLATYTTGQVCF